MTLEVAQMLLKLCIFLVAPVLCLNDNMEFLWSKTNTLGQSKDLK